ncbi:MAG: hypothetical protein IKD31_05390 [Clostridia bacterium]|nr:hypothetical protein [Clostridia bacterium]
MKTTVTACGYASWSFSWNPFVGDFFSEPFLQKGFQTSQKLSENKKRKRNVAIFIKEKISNKPCLCPPKRWHNEASIREAESKKKARVPFSQIFDGRYPIFPSRTAMGKSRYQRGTGDGPGWKEPARANSY